MRLCVMADSNEATQDHDSTNEIGNVQRIKSNEESSQQEKLKHHHNQQQQQQQQQQQPQGDEQKPNISGSITMAALNNAATNNTITSEDDYMDYDSDDDDDDSKSNHSSSNQNLNPNSANVSKQSGKNKGQSHKDEDRRAHHNVLERRRRDHLKDSFSQLRDSVPTFRSERASRTEILVQAADFIIARVQKNALMQQELDALVRENRQLEEANKSRATMRQCAKDQSDLVVRAENGPN